MLIYWLYPIRFAGPDLAATLEMVSKMYNVAFCPTVVLADSENMPSTKDIVNSYPFVMTTLRTNDPADLPALAAKILDSNNGREFDQALADEYAMASASVLESLCVTKNVVIPVMDIQNSIIKALSDSRLAIKKSAIVALGSLESTQGQRALVDMALKEEIAMEQRLMALDRAAFSARQYGNLLTTEQVNALYEISGSFKADPTLRSVACQTYGSLNLPSAKVSKLILNQSKN